MVSPLHKKKEFFQIVHKRIDCDFIPCYLDDKGCAVVTSYKTGLAHRRFFYVRFGV